jgi:transcriptional regulator with XRE-family HTH domain
VAETRSAAHRAYGQAFRQLRRARGISQERLADLAGLDRTYVSGIERGERNPSLTNLLKLAATLEVGLPDVAVRADAIVDATGSRRAQRHPISYALERSTLELKGLNQEQTAVTDEDAQDILHDASRVVAELIETLAHFESQTGRQIGVFNELETVLERLEGQWQTKGVVKTKPPKKRKPRN